MKATRLLFVTALLGLFTCFSDVSANMVTREDLEDHLRSNIQMMRRKITELEEHNRDLVSNNAGLQEQLGCKLEEVKHLQCSVQNIARNNDFLKRKLDDMERWVNTYEKISHEMYIN